MAILEFDGGTGVTVCSCGGLNSGYIDSKPSGRNSWRHADVKRSGAKELWELKVEGADVMNVRGPMWLL